MRKGTYETGSREKQNIKNHKGFIIVQIITLARIPLAILFGIILLTSKDSTLTLILCLLILAVIEASDTFDGRIARKHDLVSEEGATLDPFSDSISRLIVYWSLASQNLVLMLLPLCMAIRDITVAYSRIVLARENQTVAAKKSGKIKAIFQAVGAFLAILGPYYWHRIGNWSFYTLSWIIITVTLFSAIEYVRSALQAQKNNEDQL